MRRWAGHGTVEEHPKGSGKYRVRARVGRKRPVVISGVSRAEAEEAAAACVVLRNAEVLREGVTLAQFGIGFLERRERAGVRGIRTDRCTWKIRVEQDPLGGLPIVTLRRRDIVEWLDRQRGAHRTRIKALNLLRVGLQDAVERDLIENNPARDVRVHRAGSASSSDGLEGILTPDEQNRLVSVIPAHERPLVVFALCTGLRQAEQWWLRWEDDLGDRVIVRRSSQGLPPKSGRPREVYLLPPARAALDALPRSNRSPLVFRTKRGAQMQDGKPPRDWKKWLEAAGIDRKIRWHDLRHTCATSLLAGWWGRKWSLDEVCELLGHSAVQMTERYARKLRETTRQAVLQTQFEQASPLMLPVSVRRSGHEKQLDEARGA